MLRWTVPGLASGSICQTVGRKIRRHNANVWLVNTGWSGGAYGTGSRMPLRFTRAIIDGIHSGRLQSAPTVHDELMNLAVVSACDGVPAEMMQPRLSWRDTSAFVETSRKLAARFRKNFEQYAPEVSHDVISAGPTG
jgi:phosphoenolpyruvate carboxykinase (ATP)